MLHALFAMCLNRSACIKVLMLNYTELQEGQQLQSQVVWWADQSHKGVTDCQQTLQHFRLIFAATNASCAMFLHHFACIKVLLLHYTVLQEGQQLQSQVVWRADQLYKDVTERKQELEQLRLSASASNAQRSVGDVDNDLDAVDADKAAAERAKDEILRKLLTLEQVACSWRSALAECMAVQVNLLALLSFHEKGSNQAPIQVQLCQQMG